MKIDCLDVARNLRLCPGIQEAHRELERLETIRQALWGALVDAYVETGERLGEAQIHADFVMDSVVEQQEP